MFVAMKVLQLCIKPPYPPVDGGTLAMHCVTQGLLAQGCEVKVLSFCTDKHPVREKEMGTEYREKTGFEAVYVDLNVHLVDAAVALLCGESYHVKRYESKAFKAKLAEVLESEKYDVVHLESLFLTPYVELIRQRSDAKVVLRSHNVEHQIWERVAASTKSPLKRWYLKHLALALKVYETAHLNDYDALVSITQNDADYFRKNGCRKPLYSIPFGVEVPPMVRRDCEPQSLFHLGSMDWLPNVEGVEWFLREVWPKVHEALPGVRLYLAGRKMPERLMKLQSEGVTVVGEVPDAMDFIATKQINVVPLLSGSGIRVKIIEAMAAGKAVVATTVGAQGIDCRDGEEVLIADTAEDFVRQIRHCVEDPLYSQKIGENAAKLVAEKYNPDQQAQTLVQIYNKVVNNN